MGHLENFRYTLTGPENGRRWVFLHGLMGSGANWQKIISGLGSQERILAFDQRGHGRSFKPTKGYCPEDFADDLQLICTELNWDQIILVGHSMGGRNALNFSYRYPLRVSHLIIEDIGPEQNPNDIIHFNRLLGSIPTPFLSRDEARRFFSKDFPNMNLVKDDPVMVGQFLYANLQELENKSLDWRFFKEGILQAVVCGRQKSRWNEIESLRIPTLIIRGEKSTELSHETYLQILNCNDMISGIEVPDCGHWIHAEQPRHFLSAIQKFVGGF